MEYQENYFGFIYEWIDSTNGKTYTGSHKGSTEDGYDGSGKLFKLAFKKRPEAFTREILEYVTENNRNILLEIEQKYLNEIDWSNTYNISPVAGGGNTTVNFTKEQLKEYQKKRSKALKGKTYEEIYGIEKAKELKEKQSKSRKGRAAWNKGKSSPFKGIPRLEEIKQKISNTKKGKNIGEENHMYGKKHTEEAKQRQREARKGKEPWNKGKIGLQVAWNKGKTTPEETKQKQSVSQKKRWAMEK